MIIIYPEKSKFFGVSLYEEKKLREDAINIIMEKLNKLDLIEKDLKELKEKDLKDLREKVDKINEDKK